MSKTALKISAIISMSIIIAAILIRTKPDYHYESIGGDYGFSIRSNKTNGERCLLVEGAVRVVDNWTAMARSYPVPLKLCSNG
jgi:hypothetical protein